MRVAKGCPPSRVLVTVGGPRPPRQQVAADFLPLSSGLPGRGPRQSPCQQVTRPSRFSLGKHPAVKAERRMLSPPHFRKTGEEMPFC